MNKPQGAFALITGASKGLGKAIAIELAERGYNLILVARSGTALSELSTKLQAAYGVTAHHFAIDLAVITSVDHLINWIQDNGICVSILVNNAGFGLWGKFSSLSIADQLEMSRLNIDAVVKLSHALIPNLQDQQRAYILNISSTAAYQALPTLAIYAATKAFILSFSRALRFELKNTHISVSCLCPGPINTGFATRAGLDAFSKMAEKFNMQADEVAKIGLNGMFNNKPEIIPGLANKISAFATRILPKSFIEKTAAGIYKT